MKYSTICAVMMYFILLSVSAAGFAAPDEKEVLAAMKKGADFMTEKASVRGGYVYAYSEDISKQWGEIPARKTQIWTQPPGKPTVGMMYLEAYRITGDRMYLDYAERAANALIWGQHPPAAGPSVTRSCMTIPMMVMRITPTSTRSTMVS